MTLGLRHKWMTRGILTISIMLVIMVLPQLSYAAGLKMEDCASSGLQPWDFTQKIVSCVTLAIYGATDLFVMGLAGYMFPIVTTMFALSIVWLGVQIVGGERQLVQKGIILSIKIGFIVLFFSWPGLLVDIGVGMLAQIITIINGPYTPWVHIDSLIGKLIGVGPQLLLAQGLIGIIGASVLSSTTGIFLFMSGFMGLLDLLLFFFSIVFMYLLAITLICFMLAISPFFVPMVLFAQTEQYFTKWLKIIFSALLVPILLVTFCFFFLNIFNMQIAEIFRILGFPCSNPINLATCDSPDFREHWKLNQPLFSWLMPADPHLSQKMQSVTSASQLSDPAVQSNINPLLRRGFSNNMDANVPGVHFGPNHVAVIEQLMLAFISLWIFSSLMKSIVRKIPNIADDIAGALNRITMDPTQIESMIRKTARMSNDQMQKTAGNVSEGIKDTVNRMRNMVSGTSSGRK